MYGYGHNGNYYRASDNCPSCTCHQRNYNYIHLHCSSVETSLGMFVPNDSFSLSVLMSRECDSTYRSAIDPAKADHSGRYLLYLRLYGIECHYFRKLSPCVLSSLIQDFSVIDSLDGMMRFNTIECEYRHIFPRISPAPSLSSRDYRDMTCKTEQNQRNHKCPRTWSKI